MYLSMKFFRKLSFGRMESEVIELFKEHINTVKFACEVFLKAIETDDKSLLNQVCELERTGDRLRRDIALKLYGGAFLPAMRGTLYKLAETIDETLDMLEDTAIDYLRLNLHLDDELRELCVRVAKINVKMSNDLLEAFSALRSGDKLENRTVKIRVREREVDTLRNRIYEKIMKRNVSNYWEGKILSDFIDHLVYVSDVIEDAADLIQILNVSLR
ncbi:MAG: TIGR00153 family protein [Archaeoglobus sp.]|jgi:predicted phosphate transport protein (TIGR00153 family)|nr:MAG: TIGR00153 family protein [Archaeoglobus sp.]